jgi:hypothetical protein
MTDTQLLTVAITLLGIFIAMLVNNQRMTDLRTDIGRRIDDLAAVLRAEMRADRLETNGKLDALLTMMAGMDQRVTKLEERPR